jgi:hypothetical protein
MGHLNKGQLCELVKNSIGMDVDTASDLNFSCDICIQAKHTKTLFPQEVSTEVAEVGELTYIDTWGPARTESLHHNRYYISFTDAKTHASEVGFMKTRDSALDRFKKYQARIWN